MKNRYTVIRDSNEQKGHGWIFSPSEHCAGTVRASMNTGDYTIQGYENVLCIERKGSAGELSRNIVEKRFTRELERLEGFAHPFLILEFTIDEIINFPAKSGIPQRYWDQLQITNKFFLMRFTEISLQYKTKIIFAGSHGKEVATSIFKRVVGL